MNFFLESMLITKNTEQLNEENSDFDKKSEFFYEKKQKNSKFLFFSKI